MTKKTIYLWHELTLRPTVHLAGKINIEDCADVSLDGTRMVQVSHLTDDNHKSQKQKNFDHEDPCQSFR